MTTGVRIFVSYEAIDAGFATQLMTDLRSAGAEVITDRPDLHDTAFGQFLAQELPQCQYLIVVQTPDALKSSRVSTIVKTALNQAKEGQKTALLRVIAPTLDTVGVQGVPLRWTIAPEFDASQNYPRAWAILSLHLGLVQTSELPPIPPAPVSYKPPSAPDTPTVENEGGRREAAPVSYEPSSALDTPIAESEDGRREVAPVSYEPSSAPDTPTAEDEDGRRESAPVSYEPPSAPYTLLSSYELPSAPDTSLFGRIGLKRRENKPPTSDQFQAQRLVIKERALSRNKGNKFSLSGSSRTQRSDAKDRPRRALKYPRAPLRWRLIISSLVVAVVVATTGITIFSMATRPKPTTTVAVTPTPTPAPTPTPIPTPTPTPTPVVIIVTPASSPTPVLPATLSNGTWQGQKTFSDGQSPAEMVLTITVDSNKKTFVGEMTEATLKSKFLIAGSFTSTSADSIEITFSDTLVVQSGADKCSGCVYRATISIAKKEMNGVWLSPGGGSQQGTIKLKQTA